MVYSPFILLILVNMSDTITFVEIQAEKTCSIHISATSNYNYPLLLLFDNTPLLQDTQQTGDSNPIWADTPGK